MVEIKKRQLSGLYYPISELMTCREREAAIVRMQTLRRLSNLGVLKYTLRNGEDASC